MIAHAVCEDPMEEKKTTWQSLQNCDTFFSTAYGEEVVQEPLEVDNFGDTLTSDDTSFYGHSECFSTKSKINSRS